MSITTFVHARAASASALLVACLSACGGGSAGPATPLPVPVSAQIVITIPAAGSSSQARHAAYVSPSTKSLSAAITPVAGCGGCSPAATLKADLTTSSPGCTTSSGTTTCTIPVALNPGGYTASITTYDGASEGGNTLSSNQRVPFTITAGTTTTIPLALNGIPASLSFSTGATSVATVAGNVVTIDGINASAPVDVTMKDADGNTIIGAGAPTIALSGPASNGYSASVLVNTIAMKTPPKGTRAIGSVSGTVIAPNCPGAPVCSFTLNAAMTEFVAIGVQRETVYLYSERTKTAVTIDASPFGYGVGFDSTGDLFISDANQLSEYAPPYSGSPAKLQAPAWVAGSAPWATNFAFDANDTIYVGDADGVDPVYAWTKPYTGAPVALTGAGGGNYYYNVFVDGSNQLWVAQQGPATNQLLRYAAPVTATTVPQLIPLGAQQPSLVVQRTDNHDIAVSEYNGGNQQVAFFTTAGAADGTVSFGSYQGLAAGPGGGIYSDAPCVCEIDFYGVPSAGGGILPGVAGSPYAIGFDSSNQLIFAEQSPAGLYALSPPYTGSPTLLASPPTGGGNPYGIAIWP